VSYYAQQPTPFAILPLIPIHIGDLSLSFTNPSLFMLLTLSLPLILPIPIFLMNNSPAARKRSSTTTIGGAAGGSSGGEDDEQKRKRVSSTCKNNLIQSVRELIIELYADSGMRI
jgi:hypothetical protein